MLPAQWACPYCHSKLNLRLRCTGCGFAGRTNNGLFYLHRSDTSWQKCAVEQHGWIRMCKRRGLYRENEDHFFLPDGRPHLKDFYRESQSHIDKFLEAEPLDGQVALDLGASIGWVETYILRKRPGATLVALDVNDDPLCGLGRSAALKRHFNVEFISLVADMHCIPLADSSIDVVFSVDALHHFRELEAIVLEARRVLRPGGRFYGLNEPDRPEGANEAEYAKSMIDVELRHGIIERRPTVAEYLSAGEPISLHVANDAVGLRRGIDTAGLFLQGIKAAHHFTTRK